MLSERLSFSAKMFIGCIGLVLVTAGIMGVVNFVQVEASLTEQGEAGLKNYAEQITQTLGMQNSITQAKVDSDLVLMDLEFGRHGSVSLDAAKSVSMDIVNQVTKDKEKVTIPTLMVGGQAITNDFSIVDSVQKAVGGTATIFQVLPGKLLRVSTNVRKLDGARATGTYIPEDSPVYKTVMQGETYRGKAFVVNDWYITAYKPLRDASGKIVAVLYVGRLILTPELRELLSKVNVVGQGYAFLLGTDGMTLVHPDKEIEGRKKVTEFPFGQALMDQKDGLVRYDFGGKKIAYMRYFEPWGWNLGIALKESDMLRGLDRKLIISSLVSAAAAVVPALILVILINKLLLAPLKAAARVARAASQGDLAVRMAIKYQDEVGELCQAFNSLMDRISQTLCENENFVNMLNAVTDPIFAVDQEGMLLAANRATTRAAGRELDGIMKRRCADVLPAALCNAGAGNDLQELVMEGRTRFVQPVRDKLRDCNGKVVGEVVMAKDVTEMVHKEKELEKNLERIAQVNSAVGEAVERIAENLAAMSSQVNEASEGAEMQSRRTDETASAMDQMNSTVMDVAKNASAAAQNADAARAKALEGTQVVGRAVASIGQVQRQVLALKERMDNLGAQAEGIGRIIGVINDIADQTNLLALNAAIEAARAGDAGRGFAVVADEVRKLAEKTMTATKEVEDSIKSIQTGTREAISATESAAGEIATSTDMANQSGERLKEILSIVESTNQQVQSIATAAEEQSASSEEITRSLDDVRRISAETAQGMQAAAHSVAELDVLARKLKDLAS
jgi:methyl-accepting chemotaxis protein